MKYFLSSIVDKSLKNTVRDLRQKLKKQKRNIDFRELQYLHFDYKYIGRDLDQYTLQQIEKALIDFKNSKNIKPFAMPIAEMKFGEKGQKTPEKISIEIKHDQYFNEFTTRLHKLLVKLNNPQIVKRKDRSSWIGEIKLGTVKTGISNEDYEEIEQALFDIEIPEFVDIDNFSILRTRITNKKLYYQKVNSIKL